MAGWRIMTGNLLFADDWWRFVTDDVFWWLFLTDDVFWWRFCDWWRVVNGDILWGDVLLLVTFCEVTFCEMTFCTGTESTAQEKYEFNAKIISKAIK